MDWRWSLEQATSELILKRGHCVDIKEVDSRQNEWQVQRPWGGISLWILEARGAKRWETRRVVGKTGLEKEEGATIHGEFRSAIEELIGEGSKELSKE